MDGFDPFENHEGVLGTQKTVVEDPFSWNDNFSTEVEAGLSNGLYPSLVDSGLGAHAELSLSQPGTTDPFHQEHQYREHPVDNEAIKDILETNNPDEQQDIHLPVVDNITIGKQLDVSDSSKTGDVDPLPSIVVSDTPDGGLAANKKVNILFSSSKTQSMFSSF